MNIANIIKYNKFIYSTYYYTLSLAINAIKHIVRPQENLILINSFAGRRYDDSPRAVYDVMRVDSRFADCEFVWAFHEPDKFEPDAPTNGAALRKICTNSFRYFTTALAARVWLTNSSVERGLRFKGKRTFYLNTWHGTPLKLMGKDMPAANASFRSHGENATDVMLSQSKYETEIFSRAFGIERKMFLECGLPRNDVLANHSATDREKIREKLRLPQGKQVVLYCPTFREFSRGQDYGVVMAPPMNLDRWESALGKTHVLLIRAHYEVSKVMDIRENEFVRSMTDYKNLNDLLIAADILISDYSSVFFDYAITGKPMLHFTYDFEEYAAKRGLYFDIREYIDGGDSEDEVIACIRTMIREHSEKKTALFRDSFVDYYGNASVLVTNRIAQEIGLDKLNAKCCKPSKGQRLLRSHPHMPVDATRVRTERSGREAERQGFDNTERAEFRAGETDGN